MSERGWCGRIVGLEDVESFELLVQDCKGLKLLRFLHLLLEPVLDLILLLLYEVLVVVVEMSEYGQNGVSLTGECTSTGSVATRSAGFVSLWASLAGLGRVAHHFLVADGAYKPAGGAGGGIFGAWEQDLAGDVVLGLGGAGGTVGGLGTEGYGALRRRQQAGIAAVVGRRARRHGGRQVAPAAEDAATAQGPARGHVGCGQAGSRGFMGNSGKLRRRGS